jgi:hypothetical protein
MKRVYEVWGAQSKLEVWTTESSRFIGRKWGRKIEEQRCSYSSNLMQSIVAYKCHKVSSQNHWWFCVLCIGASVDH